MTVFPKILIANRGEIASRITRSAKKMGIRTVAIYATGEQDSLHVHAASEAYELKGDSLTETYLDTEKIIAIARQAGVTAIHPGYGFLSENENFAVACEKAGITFIGPGSQAIALMGNKTRARESAVEAGLPVIKGYTGTTGELLSTNSELEFPVLVKAAAGGGGKGMRIVRSAGELEEAIGATSREAKAYFGDDTVYIEQFIESPRHIEVQVLGDNYGNTIHLFERECSIQRRYQKIIEEAPSPSVTPAMRKKMGEAAVRLAKAIGYRNAGTVEFLADTEGNFYFLEMNTRIQVEHPVTEMITGIDIVEEQIMIAAGQKLRYTQEQLKLRGHAIECRIYSEDPGAGFIPSPGRMSCYHEPSGEGVRVDSAFDSEGEVSDRYDPMISKLITYGINREEARLKMIEALGNYGIQGVRSNISFLASLMHNNDFIKAKFSTGWCDENTAAVVRAEEKVKSANDWRIPAIAALLASLKRKAGRNNLWDDLGYWRADKTLEFCFEGEIASTTIRHLSENSFMLVLENRETKGTYQYTGKKLTIRYGNEQHNVFISENDEGYLRITYRAFRYFFRRFDFLKKKDWIIQGQTESAAGNGAIYSPMPGRVIKIGRKAGESFKKGDVLVIVESMKMENSIQAPADGIVESIEIKEGELIDGSLPLVLFQQNDTT